jgi:hypothetical protein
VSVGRADSGAGNRILSARTRPPPLTATSVRRAMSDHCDAADLVRTSDVLLRRF